MPAITIRNLSDETHHALKLLASRHGRSTEAEVRRILDEAVRPQLGLGSTLASIGRELGGVSELELDLSRDRRPVEPAAFE
jgi:plasmid stability protein